MSYRVLNLGAGRRINKNAVNVDIIKLPGIDIVYDLNDTPWPDFGGPFDRVVAWGILEHLTINLVQAMDEVWKQAAPDGLAIIRVPWYKSARTVYNGLHRWAYHMTTMDVLDPSTLRGRKYDYYTLYKWAVELCKLNKAKTSLVFRLKKISAQKAEEAEWARSNYASG